MLDFAQKNLRANEHLGDFQIGVEEPWQRALLFPHALKQSFGVTLVDENTQRVKARVKLWSTEIDLTSARLTLRVDRRTKIGRRVAYVPNRRFTLFKSFRSQSWLAADESLPHKQEVAENRRRTRAEKFLPSARLTQYWVKGLHDHLKEVDIPSRYRDGIEATFSEAIEKTAAQFSTRLQRIFAIVGNRQRYNIEQPRPITVGQSFSLPFQHHIIDRIPIRPDQYSEFFALFYAELLAHLQAGGLVAGSWGRLVLRRSEIHIDHAAPPALRNTAGWQRAKVLE
jgi:hypothetical protein